MAISAGTYAVGNTSTFDSVGSGLGPVGLRFNGVNSYTELLNNITLKIGDVLSFEYLHIINTTTTQSLTDSKGGTGTRCSLNIAANTNILSDTLGIFGAPASVLATLTPNAFTSISGTVVTTSSIGIFGSRFSYAQFCQGIIRNIKINGIPFYITQNSDYGTSALIDHSGNNNNGTLTNTAWTWDGVLGIYSNLALFNADIAPTLTGNLTGVVVNDTSGVGFATSANLSSFNLNIQGLTGKEQISYPFITMQTSGAGTLYYNNLVVNPRIGTYAIQSGASLSSKIKFNDLLFVAYTSGVDNRGLNLQAGTTSATLSNLLFNSNHAVAIRLSTSGNMTVENCSSDALIDCTSSTANVIIRNSYFKTITSGTTYSATKVVTSDSTGSESSFKNISSSAVFVNISNALDSNFLRPIPTVNNILKNGVSPIVSEALKDYDNKSRPQSSLYWIGARQPSHPIGGKYTRGFGFRYGFGI